MSEIDKKRDQIRLEQRKEAARTPKISAFDAIIGKIHEFQGRIRFRKGEQRPFGQIEGVHAREAKDQGDHPSNARDTRILYGIS
jgi:hypothetical protein